MNEEAVLNAIDADEVASLTSTLIQAASVNPPGDYARVSELVEGVLRGCPLEVAIFEGSPGRPNVFGLLPGSQADAPTLLLSGHMDVHPVSDKEKWQYDPFAGELVNGVVWGRGAVDMKGALAAQLCALKAICLTVGRLPGSVILGATVDDEVGGPMGMRYVLEDALERRGWPVPGFHVLGEPNNLNITVAFKGRIWVEVEVDGKAAHGGAPEEGVNAIERMVDVIRRVTAISRNEHPLMGRDTVNVGVIEGGQRVNQVPAFCKAQFDYRYCAPVGSAEAEARFARALEGIARPPGCGAPVYRVFERREPVEQDPNAPPVRLLVECIHEVTGRRPAFLGALSAGDAYYTLRRGIPACWVGPGDPSLMHAANERISVEQLVQVARVYALFAVRYCR